MENKYLCYKGRPLVRCGNEMYFGNMTDTYIILIKETETKQFNSVELGTKFEISLLYTDPDIKGRGKIIKTSEKKSFADAMQIAEVWLERANAK